MCWWNDHSNARINNNTGHWPLVKIAINFESHVHTRTESEAGESTRLLLVKSDIEVADIGEYLIMLVVVREHDAGGIMRG
jgi:hypothetical protein